MAAAAMYLRVSTEEQSDRYGLDLQNVACTNYAKVHKLKIKSTYTDAVSGQTTDRPGVQSALAAAKKGEFTDIIFYDHTRLGRTQKASASIREQLEDAGVAIHYTTTGTYDSDSETGVLLDALGDAMSEIEVKRFVRRARAGKRQAAVSGKVVIGGKIPFGYKRNGSGLKLDPTNAKHVKRMFTQFNSGKSLRWIAKDLEDRKVPTNYGAPWTPSTVTKMLRREHYIGNWYFGQTKMVKGKKVAQPKEDWIRVSIPKIVTKTEWNSAQKILKSNARKSAKHAKHSYLVRGRITCSVCNENYRGRAKHYQKANGGVTSHFYYKHGPKNRTCGNDNLWLRRDQVEADVKAELIAWLTDPKKKWEIYLDEQNLEAAEVQAELTKIVAKRKKLAGDFARARKLLVEGTLDKENFQEEAIRIREEDEELKKRETEKRNLLEPDIYEEIGDEAYYHELQDHLKNAKVEDFAEKEWFKFIDDFNLKVGVLPKNKRGKRRFRITSTIGKKTVTKVNGHK